MWHICEWCKRPIEGVTPLEGVVQRHLLCYLPSQKTIEVYLHSNPEGYAEIAELYANDLGVDWDENDDRWNGIYGLMYETALLVTIDLETGNIVKAEVKGA